MTDGVNVERLAAWLAANVDGAAGPARVDQLSGGSSNLTYRVRDDVNDWVLRRPPLAHVLATANDMKREYTVQTALRGTGLPIARTVALCDDETVVGAPFYLMEWLDGIVFNTTTDVAHLTEDRALATFKLACIAEGAHARHVISGDTRRAADADTAVRSLATIALDAARPLGHAIR
jgi:aminoglycoside phosphotransferase (APT) family kinase protein